MIRLRLLLAPVFIAFAPPLVADDGNLPSREALEAFQARLSATTTKHLDALLDDDGNVRSLTSKSADGMTAFAFYDVYQLTGRQAYRNAAVRLAERILDDMRKTKFGVIYIKEKDRPSGETIQSGGPPAFGIYVAAAAHILHEEGNRADDLKYLGKVVDRFPWNDEGWWASTIDVNTGETKVGLDHPTPINKTASVAAAAAALSRYLRDDEPKLSARLKEKADRCIYRQVLPAQEADGYWHYGLTGKDPKSNDILGYYMVTLHALIDLEELSGEYRDAKFRTALEKAHRFALECIAPMTDPNDGPPCRRTTPSTPKHYEASDDPRRGFALGMILAAGGNHAEMIKIVDHWSRHYPIGNTGAEGAHAAYPSGVILRCVRREIEASSTK